MAEFKKASRDLTVVALGVDAMAVAAALKPGESKDVAAFTGIASKMKIAPSRNDPTKDSVKFQGQFRGYNLVTGEIVEKGSLYLPGLAQVELQSMMDMADGEPVEFGFKLAITRDAPGGSPSVKGYVWSVYTALEPKKSDRLEGLAAELGLPTAGALQITDQSEGDKPAKKSAKK